MATVTQKTVGRNSKDTVMFFIVHVKHILYIYMQPQNMFDVLFYLEQFHGHSKIKKTCTNTCT